MFSITRYIYMLADIDAVDMDSVDVCNNVVTMFKGRIMLSRCVSVQVDRHQQTNR